MLRPQSKYETTFLVFDSTTANHTEFPIDLLISASSELIPDRRSSAPHPRRSAQPPTQRRPSRPLAPFPFKTPPKAGRCVSSNLLHPPRRTGTLPLHAPSRRRATSAASPLAPLPTPKRGVWPPARVLCPYGNWCPVRDPNYVPILKKMEVFPALIGPHDDFKELWETDLDPAMQEVLRLNAAGDVIEWSYLEKDLPGVVIHDRLMTDAALGTRPIKTEHSYSLASDGDSLPDSPISHNKLEDMDDECFPAMDPKDAITIKDEPISETDSIHSSCPSSPQSSFMNTSELHFDVDMKSVKPANIMISSPHNVIPQRIQVPKLSIKLEPGGSFHLPPTPPSCSSSDDSEDNATMSQPPSPGVRKGAARSVMLAHHHHAATRQPIHTPLISSQPKGSTGSLLLTEEEKRTLIAEGYPVPTRLPLTKAEEKSLKKIRRKIKNKISAQESRRKKKEYMDQLERKVEILVSENNDFRTKIETLEDSNSTLLGQLQKLQAIVARTHPQLVKQLK